MEEIIRRGDLRVLATESSCDVVISCIGFKLMAHRIILSIASPVLQGLLQQDNSQPTVLIFPDITATTMTLILDYIYSGHVTLQLTQLFDFLTVSNLLQLKIEDDYLKMLKALICESPANYSKIKEDYFKMLKGSNCESWPKEDFLKIFQDSKICESPANYSKIKEDYLRMFKDSNCESPAIDEFLKVFKASKCEFSSKQKCSGLKVNCDFFKCKLEEEGLRKRTMPGLIPIGKVRKGRSKKGLLNKVFPSPWTPREEKIFDDPRVNCGVSIDCTVKQCAVDATSKPNDSNNNVQMETSESLGKKLSTNDGKTKFRKDHQNQKLTKSEHPVVLKKNAPISERELLINKLTNSKSPIEQEMLTKNVSVSETVDVQESLRKKTSISETVNSQESLMEKTSISDTVNSQELLMKRLSISESLNAQELLKKKVTICDQRELLMKNLSVGESLIVQELSKKKMSISDQREMLMENLSVGESLIVQELSKKKTSISDQQELLKKNATVGESLSGLFKQKVSVSGQKESQTSVEQLVESDEVVDDAKRGRGNVGVIKKRLEVNRCEKITIDDLGKEQLLEEGNDAGRKVEEVKEKKYKCGECGKGFSQLRNYKYHRSIHDGTKKFSTTCPECGKVFNDRGYLSSHMKIHRDRKEYACQHCPKRFNQRVAYNMHLRIHTGVKPHVCGDCGKSFSRKMLLKQHQRVHTGERPYTCQECGKSFADRSNMSLHARLHTGVKPYSCTLCPKSFTKKHHLKTHMNFHMGIKPYSCQKCGLAFSQSSNMRTHYKKCVLKNSETNT